MKNTTFSRRSFIIVLAGLCVPVIRSQAKPYSSQSDYAAFDAVYEKYYFFLTTHQGCFDSLRQDLGDAAANACVYSDSFRDGQHKYLLEISKAAKQCGMTEDQLAERTSYLSDRLHKQYAEEQRQFAQNDAPRLRMTFA